MAEDKDAMISELLGMLGDNPEEKIMAALSTLGGGKEESQEEAPVETSENNGMDIEGFIQIASLMSELGSEDDRSRLLSAIKPFLSEERRPKVDGAIKLLRLAKMAEAAGKADLLKHLKL